MKTIWTPVTGLVLLLTAGCAFTPQAIELKPEITVRESSIGQSHSVRITVVDERPKSTLGTRGVRGVGAELTIMGHLPTILRSSIQDGLKRQGFSPTTEKALDGRELRVEIRNLDYELIQGFWAGRLRTSCGLKAICIRGTTRPYERLHRGEYDRSVQVAQTDEANNLYVNYAVSRALDELLRDQQLTACLAE